LDTARAELFPAKLRWWQMAGDRFVGEAVRSVRAVDQKIGGTAPWAIAELPVPRSIASDHHFVRHFGKLISGDIDDDAAGFDLGVALAVEAADSVHILGGGKSVFAQIMAQQKADRTANVFRETGDDEADLGVDLGRIRGADGAPKAFGEGAQSSDLWRLVHKARFHCDRGVAQRASGSLH
jgi:hypothetical protein